MTPAAIESLMHLLTGSWLVWLPVVVLPLGVIVLWQHVAGCHATED